MRRLSYDFKYKIKDNKLIIESCPDRKLDSSLIRDLLEGNVEINEIDICEGIEEIGDFCFKHLNNIDKVTLPNSLKRIGREAFSYCLNLKEISFPNNPINDIEISEDAFFHCMSLKNINIKKGVTSIGYGAFAFCESLEKVYLPNSLKRLGEDTFSNCDNLKTVRLPTSLEKIESSTFYYCRKLENIVLPKNLKQIDACAFKECRSLTDISLPSSLVEIGGEAFSDCIELKSITFNEGLEEIGFSAFSHCKNLEEIILPSTLKNLGERSFMSCGKLKKVVMNDGVTKLGESVFSYCTQLDDITLSSSIREIPSNVFYDCFNLKKIVIPDSVQILHEDAFYRCKELKEIVLSKNIKKIATDTFERCDGLERIVVPDGVEEIEERAFACASLKEIYLPRTLKSIDVDAFEWCTNLTCLYLKNKNDIVKLYRRWGLVRNPDNIFFSHCFDDDICGFYMDGEYIEFNENELLNNDKISKIIQNNHYDRGMYIKLYYYNKKRFIPSNIVIENMPLKDIDNFYINNNGKEWAKLVNASVNVTLDENKASFFKLCYVLGLFSESTSIRDRAVNFLNEKIVNKLDGYQIHSRFDGFDLSNGFNEEYAEFFIKYYNHKDFMIDVDADEWGDKEEIDLMAASYNNFKQVKKVYPNKTLHTNREADLLLPEHVMDAIRIISYEDVDEGNEEFAKVIGRYGYTQEQFEKLQSWYNTGKSLTNISLFVGDDTEAEGITYKLLSKDDPLNAVLGNITNCCQVLEGQGEDCVEYGMTRDNSGFITFNYKDQIIGQAWIWYDSVTSTVCLDNIEVPHRYLEKINSNKTIQKSFIDCLMRLSDSIKNEMHTKGLRVDKVTIGEGYNDVKAILNSTFSLSDKACKLSDYSGYSDASSQYEIKTLNITKKR